MTAAQLRLLGILGRKLVPNAVQQLDIALLGILPQGSDESPRHGASGLASDLGVLTRLIVLATRPHDNVRRAGLGLLVALVHFITLGSLLEETHGGGHHAAHVAPRIRRHHTQETLASFLGQIGLLEHTRGGVDIGKVEGGAGVA